MTQLRSKRVCEGYEPIAGYVLEERIGQGGYGEVWRASAPGGLKKAVKFVFGTQTETRATRELKSLERIRGVQHPFLLTLERFEAIDDQLVIVTELADCSLEDVYRSNRDRGSCGIARDVLLSHLRDTADALDYLHQQYQLQHLDIKPGNLLLFGGHVKVADFGLLKDLGDVDCSMVGGLTPTYAPPELFDGRPSLHSDQYSLAVMYQELLTGTRPFSGRTIAQLATQHVHAAPNLDPLPSTDRPVVARALEKDPNRRFPNCMAFVEALTQASHRKAKSGSVPSEPPEPLHRGDVKDLPHLDESQSTASGKRPVLVVALGGTGANCLRMMRQRVFESGANAPLSLHGLLIDTDADTAHSLQVADLSEESPTCTVLHTPLRTPQQYRESGTTRLASVSRRWIYNVPRSGATEGMRPLGRLALVDHGEKVRQTLLRCVESLPRDTGESPAVYVVGSLCGGTASGMYLDVVHLLRHLLDEAGWVDASILSLLATPPMQADPTRPLAALSALAAMRELGHFLKPGNCYPGDAGAGWPSVPAARTPLHDLYLVSQPQRNSLTRPAEESIVQYLWTDGGNGHELLAAARKLELKEDQSVVSVSVRTLGCSPMTDPRQAKREMLAPPLVRNLLIEWLGLPSQARQDSGELSQRVMRRSGLTAEALSAIAADPTEWIQRVSRELAVCLSDRRADVTTVIECLKRIAEWSESLDVPVAASFNQAVQEIANRMERFATGLALAIVETTKIQSADEDPWNQLSDELQQQFGQTLNQLHSMVQNEWLVRPLMQPRFEIDPVMMVQQITRQVEPILTDLMLGADQVTRVTATDSMVGNSTNVLESQIPTDVTQAIEGLTNLGTGSLTVPEAVMAAKPQLLSVGGMQRLLLVVGNTYEKTQLEPQVRAAFDGALSVAVIRGAAPHLIHEGQQIELTKVIAHLSALHGGHDQVTARLSTRSDVHWQ